ncbi:hypothetical protein [Clostridium hydrogeniformans]|uniref:hypothetical protein n=1 Tax=Clostridium hydrogeniformans TaxID=349933 RepID=UPI000482E16C|nr:hypothetical protein [Clostridium hydrogeniformans]
MKGLFSLFGSSSSLGKLFPELQKPFNGLIKDIKVVKKLYEDLKSTGQGADSKGNLNNSKEKSIDGFKELEKSSESLKINGGKFLSDFSFKSVGSFLAIVAVITAVIALTKKLLGSLANMAKQDIEHEKLSRQLWTTKENAKDIDSALKTLGATMEDLWLSPTLLKQFNQLRKDSQSLRLPPEFQNNIKVIQGIGLEFKRLKQLGSLAMQWIGHYILKYIAGPLAEFRKKFSNFNNKFIKVIPAIAKVIGSAIGIILRILLLIFKLLSPIFIIISKIVGFIIGLVDKIPAPLKNILKIIGAIAALIMAGPVGAIIFVLGLLDDLFTFLRGGKSIIGSVFGFFKDIGSSAIDALGNKLEGFKEKFKKAMEGIKDKIKGVFGKIKDFFNGEETETDIQSKIDVYHRDIEGNRSTPPSYTSSSNTANNETTTNSNNRITNTNTIQIYGNDSNSNANAVDRKLRGINTRSLQGVY